jgi:hypothetical protein
MLFNILRNYTRNKPEINNIILNGAIHTDRYNNILISFGVFNLLVNTIADHRFLL